MEKTISLKPDYKLLNPDFDGYKLSSDADVTVYTHTLESHEGLERTRTNSNCYLHTRLEALHNHFFGDPYNASFVYYFSSKGHLVKHNYSKDSRLSAGEVVWQADLSGISDETNEDKFDNSHYFASVYFPSSDLAVVTNGLGSLHVLETGDRTTTHSWLESFECSDQQGILVHARLVEGGPHERHLHCLLMSITAPQNLVNNDLFVVDEKIKTTKASALHLINWVVITYNGATWEMGRTRTIAGEGTVEYCSLDEKTTGILLLCHKHYSFVYDSKEPLVRPKLMLEEKKKSGPKFTFLQTPEDISLWVNIGTAKKNELQVNVTVQELSINVQETQVLHGTFANPVNADSATWTISDGKLEIILPKASEGLNWKEMFQSGDSGGEELLDPQLVEEVNQRLAHLTSDKLDANPDPDKPAYNPGQFEACDEASEDLLLLRLDGSTHSLTTIGLLGPTQHLFNCQVQGSVVPSFCIRQDVDGILWQPEDEEKFTHTATYNAFGYVKASKTMAKFTCAAIDNSYVAVADVKSHIYVFFQPEAFGGELRNRKSGKRLNSVARQVVISMKTHDEILGLQASPNVLFVLTEKSIFAYCLRNP